MSTTSTYPISGQVPTLPKEQLDALLALDAEKLEALAALSALAEPLAALAAKSEEILASIEETEPAETE